MSGLSLAGLVEETSFCLIEIKHNTKDASKLLKGFAKHSLPKAAVSAMNSCSYEARARLTSELPTKIKVKRDWVVRQIRYEKVKLEHWPKLKARIGSGFRAMHYHEHGGVRAGKRWPYIGVPMTQTDPAAAKRILSKPASLIKRNNYHVIKHKGKSFLIYKPRVLKGRRRRPQQLRPKIQMLFVFKERVINKPKWNMREVVQKVFAEKYATLLKRRIG